MENTQKENIPALMKKVADILILDGHKEEAEIVFALTKVIQYRINSSLLTQAAGMMLLDGHEEEAEIILALTKVIQHRINKETISEEEDYYKSIDCIYDYIKTDLLEVDNHAKEQTNAD